MYTLKICIISFFLINLVACDPDTSDSGNQGAQRGGNNNIYTPPQSRLPGSRLPSPQSEQEDIDINSLSFSQLIELDDDNKRNHKIVEQLKENPNLLTKEAIDKLLSNDFKQLGSLMHELDNTETQASLNTIKEAALNAIKSHKKLVELNNRDDFKNCNYGSTTVSEIPKGQTTPVTTNSYTPLKQKVARELRDLFDKVKRWGTPDEKDLGLWIELIQQNSDNWDRLFAELDKSRLAALAKKDFAGFATESKKAQKKADDAKRAAELDQKQKDQAEAARLATAEKLKPKGLDEAINAHKKDQGMKHYILDERSKRLNGFITNHKTFFDKLIDSTNMISKSVSFINKYDESKIDPAKVEQFKATKQEIDKWLRLILSGAPKEEIDAAHREGIKLVINLPLEDYQSGLNAIQNIAISTTAIHNFSDLRDDTVAALKGINQHLKEKHGLKEPNDITTLVAELEKATIDSTTKETIEASIILLGTANTKLQALVKKFE